MMRALAKAGFTQSYTYFTWRNTKSELTEYLTELMSYPTKEYFHPNFFTNTPISCRFSCKRRAAGIPHSLGAGGDLVAGLRHL